MAKKRPRVMLTMSEEMIDFIDRVCEDYNAKNPMSEKLTRSRFVAACVIEYYKSIIPSQDKPN